MRIMIHHVPAERSCDSRATYNHFGRVVQKIWDSKNAYASVRALAGKSTSAQPAPFPPPLEKNCPALDHPMQPVVNIDIDYIFSTVLTNTFGIGTAFLADDESDNKDETGFGLYAEASLLNHSCVPSAHKIFLGDAIAVRASQDMKKGEEVTLSYLAPRCYDERRFRLARSWGFYCNCALCIAEGKDDEDARKKRSELVQKMASIFKELSSTYSYGAVKKLVAKAKASCDEIRLTYTGERASGGYADVLRPELAEALRNYASTYEKLASVEMDATASHKMAINLKMDALGLEGLHVIDRSVSGPIKGIGKGKEGRFPVDVSRLSPYSEVGVMTMFKIVKRFEYLGEQKRAQRWFDAAIEGTFE